MNVNSLYGMIRNVTELYQKLNKIVSNSQTVIWLRSKTKKSRILRWLLILLSMYLTTKIYHLIKKLISAEYARRISGGAGGAMAAAFNDGPREGNGGNNINPAITHDHRVISAAPISSSGTNGDVGVGGDVDASYSGT